MIDASVIRAIAPKAPDHITAGVCASMDEVVAYADLTSDLRLAHFLGQLAHESAGFARTEENLNYRAPRIRQVWPRRFATIAAAQPYASKPAELANRVYANRMGNGPESSGDGWRYRGRGLIMTTGKEGYTRLSERLGVDFVANPDLLKEFPYAILSAAEFWKSKNLNAFADDDDVLTITKRINGGTIGLADRKTYLARAKRAISNKAA